MTLRRTAYALAAATLALSAAACAGAPRELPRASAVEEVVRIEMPVDPVHNGLTWAQIELVETLAAEYKARGHGPFVISYPQNAGNADAALDAIAETRTRLYAAGLDWTVIAGGAYEARGRDQAPVVFSFDRYRAVAPACPDGWTDLRAAPAGDAWPRFGCATARNIAAMVADPADLAGARDFDDPDAARRQTVLDRWRQGQPTSTQRAEGESGAVSEVVE